MQNIVLISAIIPTYNRQKTLTRAIESIISQDYPVYEIIVVDDGSQDNTKEIARTYGDSIRYIYQNNSGVSVARNKGAFSAKGDWIAFLDSDDYWAADYTFRIVKAIESTNGQASLYFTDTLRSERMDKCLHWSYCNFKIKNGFELKRDASEWALMPIQPMIMPSTVILKKTFFEVGGILSRLQTREDTYLFLKIGLNFPICAVAGVGAIITDDGSNRLTKKYGSLESLTYWENSKLLYQEVLGSSAKLNGRYRKLLKKSLSNSFYSIGRILLLNLKYKNCIKNFIYSFIISPETFLKRFNKTATKIKSCLSNR